MGLSKFQTDDSFYVFTDPALGFRALCRLLRNYERKYGLNTVRGIIARWAPPNENNTDAYVNFVCTSMGVKPDDKIDLNDRQALFTLAKAIARKEGGRRPDGSDWFAASDILAGVDLALGVVT